MSKLITGYVKVTDLDVIREAATALGWPVQAVQDRQGGIDFTVHVKDQYATYRPYIHVSLQDGQTKLTYDHWMAFSSGNTDEATLDRTTDHDKCTTRVIGKFKQAIAKAQVERLLKQQKASWRVEQRADGAQVLVVRR